MIKLVEDKDFKYYHTLLSRYSKDIQEELGYPNSPKNIEITFAAVENNEPYAWASLKKMKMDNGIERYVLFAPMLVGSNDEVAKLMEGRIRVEAKKRRIKELLHIGLFAEVAKSFGFVPTTYENLEGQLNFCLECPRRAKTHCQPMVMKI